MINFRNILLKIKKVRQQNFIVNCDTKKLKKKFQNGKSQKVMLINKGSYEYGYFNFTFLDNMLSSIVDVINRGYIPVVRLDGRKEGWTNWDTFFEQPFQISSDCKQEEYPFKTGLLMATFSTPLDSKKLRLWQKIYSDFAILNKPTQQYVDKEYQELIAGKKVMGVLCRGTDYVKKKPFGHPVQPEVEDVIELVKQKMQELGLDYIYLATEEYRIVKQFEAAFPDKIIVNKRTYYDEIFYQNNCTDIYQVNFERENDIYLKGLEYLASIWLLSRCDALVAGNCGGSTSAIYLNNGKYRFWHLFDLGLYGVNK